MKKMYLISKAWIDPIENKNTHGYKPYRYTDTIEEAEKICKECKVYTAEDCHGICYEPNGLLPLYRYEEIKHYNELELNENMTDQELIDKCKIELSRLCNSGGKSFNMSVPPQEDDTDILFRELIDRYQEIIDKN